MSDYEPFLIPVEVIGGKDAENTLKNIDSKLKEISEDLMNVGYGADAMKTLTADMRALSSTSKTVASGISALNKANAQAAKDAESVALANQKVATEAGRTARELEKAKTQAANTAVANQKLSTELEKTALTHAKAEMAALRVAQAHEKQAQKAQQAALPYNKLNQELREQAQRIKDVIAGTLTGDEVYTRNERTLQRMVDKYNRLKSELEVTNQKFQKLTATQKENKNVTETLKIAFGSFLGILSNQVLMRMTQMFRDFVTSISQAGIALDGITNTFAAGARGWKQGGEEMEWVANTAEKLGLNLQSTYEPYAKFLTSFTRSGGTLQESRQIFEDLSTAMVSLHLSSAQMNDVFVALEQMANKGTVQAEELKRQLGNALPGAFELAAQAMEVTTAELMDMMKKGQVVSRNFLPKFAALVKDSLGTQVGIAADQYNSHLNRLKSQTFLLQTTLGQMLNEALTPVVKGLTDIVKTTNSVIKIFNQSALATTVLQSAFLAAVITLGVYVKETIAATTATIALATAQGTVAPALTTFQKLLLGVNNLLKTKVTWTGLATVAANGLRGALTALAAHPIAATLLVIGSAALYVANSINKSKKAFQEQYVQIQDVSNNAVGLISDYSQLAAVQNRSVAQQEAYNRALESLKEAYPEILGYIDTNKINLNNLTQAQAEHIASLAIMQKMQEAEKVKLDELNDKWSITQLRFTQFVKIFKIGAYAIEGIINHLWVAFKQLFARIFSGFTSVGAFVAKWGSKIADKLGFKEWASEAKEFEQAANEATKILRDYGKDRHQIINSSLKQLTLDEFWSLEKNRVAEIESRYKDTVAKLGKEQQQIVKMLTYSSNALSNVATGKSGQKKGGKSDKKSQAEDAWQALNRQANETLELIRVKKVDKENTDKLEKTYLKYKKQIDEVNKAIEKLNKQEKQINMTAAEQAIKTWEDKKKALQDAEKQYKGMLLAGNAYNESEKEQQRVLMKTLKAETQYADYLANRENLMQISSRTARDFGNTVVDAIFNPMEGQSFWDRLKDVGLSALKSIAASWSKVLLDGMVKGFGLGFAETSGGFFQKIGGGLLGMMTGYSGKALNFFGQNNTTSAVSNATSAIASTASSTGVAATTVGALSTALVAAQPAIIACTPALTAMAGAMTGIAASASTAASAMAAFAIAAAAASVATIPVAGAVLAPVAALATGAAIAAGTALTGAAMAAGSLMAGAGQMIGGTMSGIGNKLSGTTSVVPHAKGGIVSSPTMFPMQGGNIGLAGEAGTEVIAPARRMSNGDVGIGAVQPKVTVNNYTNSAVEVIKRPDNEMEIKITELNAMLSSSRTNKGWANAQARMSKQGRQIG